MEDGETLREPDAETLPTPLSMLTDDAFVADHVSVAVWPAAIVTGETLRFAAGSSGRTVTVTDFRLDPPAFVAVIVYVVVVAGLTNLEPEAATVPIPWFILTDVAFIVNHDKLADCPTVIVTGFAVKFVAGEFGGGGGLTFTVTFLVIDPPAFVAVSVYAVVVAGVTVLVPDVPTVPIP